MSLNIETLDAALRPEEKLYEASRGRRLANYIIDSAGYFATVFLFAFVVGIFMAMGNLEYNNPSEILIQSIFFAWYVGYFTLSEFLFNGRTLGKLITRTKAVTAYNQRITLKDAFVRSLCRLLPFEPISFLFSEKGWHDTISKTKVIELPKK